MISTSKTDRKFKLPVEKRMWNRWGENDNVPSNQKPGLLLWFGSGCCFEDVGALMCSLAAGHKTHLLGGNSCYQLHDKKGYLPKKTLPEQTMHKAPHLE